MAAVCVAVAWPSWELSAWSLLDALRVLLCVGLVVGGLRLAVVPGQSRNGRLLVAAGVLETVATVRWDAGPFAVLGWMTGALAIVPLAWLLLQYPDDRLRDRGARAFVVAFLAATLLLRLLEIVLWDPAWTGYAGEAWWPTLVRSLPAHTAVAAVMWTANTVLAGWFVVLLLRHHRALRGLTRRQQVPLLVSGLLGAIVLGVVVPVGYLIGLPGTEANPVVEVVVYVSQVAALLVILASFAVSALLSALDRARISPLVVDIQRAGDPRSLEQAMRRALDDPGLRLLVREDASSTWVDSSGRRTQPPQEPHRTFVSLSTPHEGSVQALDVDASLARDSTLLDAATSACRLALDNARLHALAQARLEDVQRSRRRLAHVGLEERRRLERDLHDGAQQRLLAVAADVAAARASTSDPALQSRLDGVRDGLREALQELRDLANGIHPAVLSQAGLAPAVESAAERLDLPTRVDIEDRRWPAEVETAAYFVTSEALANAVKHARASVVTVSATTSGSQLHLTVADDGIGGASAADGRGGLTGIADRVTALGGTVSVGDGVGGGTVLEVRIPCE
jgi:signal transduction histidine kinase